MSSTITLNSTVNYASQCVRGQPLTGVLTIPNEPAFTMANWVRQFILSAPFSWRWNRKQQVFNAISGVQDYNVANYLLYSQDLTNAAWTEAGITTAISSVAAPDGSMTATELTPVNFANSNITQNVTASALNTGLSQNLTFSVWLRLEIPGTLNNFNVSITVASTTVQNVISSLTTVWTRYSITIPVSGYFNEAFVQLGGTSYVTGDLQVLAWGAQLESSTVPNTYVPTTSAPLSLFSNLGFLEMSSASNGTTQWGLEVDLNQAQDIVPAQPRSISPYLDNNGFITFRLLPVPDTSYTVNVNYQAASPVFQNLTDTWAPIPDYYYYLVQTGFLAKTYEYTNDDRFPTTMQLFVKQVVAANAGLADTQNNIFASEFINTQRELQSQIGNSQSGRAARGLFG